MHVSHDSDTINQAALADHGPMVLDEAANDAATLGAVVAQPGPWRYDLIQLLNDSLATELVCVLRYKRHYFTACAVGLPKIAQEFLDHANQESAHSDRLARRIVQLGGKPDFAPDSLTRRSHAAYDDSVDLEAMIRADLTAERVAIECYGQAIAWIADRDPATRRLVEDILGDEQRHADALSRWLRPESRRPAGLA